MTQTDYDHKKRECWEEFWRNGSGPINRCPETYEALETAFYASFDRAYALGKPRETISQGKINGIIISGKVYEAVRYDGISPCIDCALTHECDRIDEAHKSTHFCGDYLEGCIFRYSPSLTERLNNPNLLNGK